MNPRARWLVRCALAFLVLLWFALPTTAAFALLIADNAITASDFVISSSSATATISPFNVSASTNAFNSLGESAADGPNTGTNTDVSANAAVTWAQGQAQAKASTGAAQATSAINLPGALDLAGVTLPGSLADLSGTFSLTGVSGMVNVTFSVQVSGHVHGFADSIGILLDDDVNASLFIDGIPVLFFDPGPLAGGPGFPDTNEAFSQTLTTTVSLDSSVSHAFNLHLDAESEGLNLVSAPEPASFLLIVTGLALLGRYGAITRNVVTKREAQASRLDPPTSA